MIKEICSFWMMSSIILALTVQLSAQPRINIDMSQPGVRIDPTMWGIFFEDINFGADGGLYAELVKNRSFEFTDAMMGWSKIQKRGARGVISIRDEEPFETA